MDSREQLWHATNDHIRDLMELVEGRLNEPPMQRRWRLAMSAFARRAAIQAGLLIALPALDELDRVLDQAGSRALLEVATARVQDSEARSAAEADAICSALTALRSLDAETDRLFEVMYWQGADDAFPDPDAEHCVQAAIFKDIFGNPFRPVAFDPAWRSESAVALARAAYESRNFTLLPVLADALEEAGCDHPDVLAHCRGPGLHVRGCWVVDGVLGKRARKE